jgi:hypothetical protein
MGRQELGLDVFGLPQGKRTFASGNAYYLLGHEFDQLQQVAAIVREALGGATLIAAVAEIKTVHGPDVQRV